MSGGWKPIGTAPQDGSEILSFHDGEFTVVYWFSYPDGVFGAWLEASCGACEIFPTHWQPLPEQPTLIGEPVTVGE